MLAIILRAVYESPFFLARRAGRCYCCGMEQVLERDWKAIAADFEKRHLPRIERQLSYSFRHLKGEARLEAMQKARTQAWLLFRQDLEAGNNPADYISRIAGFAVNRANINREITGCEPAKDVMSLKAQLTHGYTVTGLPDKSTLSGNEITEGLTDKKNCSVPDQVWFRVDIPRWLDQIPNQRDREIAEGLMQGYSTTEMAKVHGVSLGRIAQIRRELYQNLQEFEGEAVAR